MFYELYSIFHDCVIFKVVEETVLISLSLSYSNQFLCFLGSNPKYHSVKTISLYQSRKMKASIKRFSKPNNWTLIDSVLNFLQHNHEKTVSRLELFWKLFTLINTFVVLTLKKPSYFYTKEICSWDFKKITWFLFRSHINLTFFCSLFR